MNSRKLMSLVLLGCLAILAGCQNKRGPSSSGGGGIGSQIKGLKTVYFDFDKSNLRDDQQSILQGNGDFLKTNSGVRVVIEGHCDERGTNEYNMALGDRRARTAKNYLINLGIDPNRLNTISYGEERPVASCHDESCWWQNRRDEFVK